MYESIDSIFSHEDIIVETVSFTRIIEKGNITLPIASKQTEDITTKQVQKRRNADGSDIKSCRKMRKDTGPSFLTTVVSSS